MKKIIIFLALIMSTESIAQNSPSRASNAPKSQPQNSPTTTANISKQTPPAPESSSNTNPPSEEIQKRMDESKDLDLSIKNLSPEKRQKFNKINTDFIEKLTKVNSKFEASISKISNIKNIMMINGYLFPNKNNQNREMPKEFQQTYNSMITQYNKLSKEKRKATKQEIIRFRKEIMAIQKERRKQIKDLFGKDYSIMSESESEEQIKKDEDLLKKEK